MRVIEGPICLYFNRHHPTEGPWCICAVEPSLEREVCVVGVRLLDAEGCAVYRPKETDDQEDGVPSAWLVFSGHCVIDSDNFATVRPDK